MVAVFMPVVLVRPTVHRPPSTVHRPPSTVLPDLHLAAAVADMMVPFGVGEVEVEAVKAGVAEFALDGGGVGSEVEQRAKNHVARGAHDGFKCKVWHGKTPVIKRGVKSGTIVPPDDSGNHPRHFHFCRGLATAA